MADVTENSGAVETSVNPASGANTEASPTPNSGGNTPTQATSPANTPASTTENLPFHEHPRFKQLTKSNAEFRKMNEEANRKLAELEARFSGFTSAQPQNKPTISDEDSQALRKLFGMAANDPEVKKMLGLDKVGEYQQELTRIQEAQLEEKFNGEFSEVNNIAKSMGLDPSEVEDGLREAFESHPVYSQLDYRPGLIKEAFHALNFSKAKEIAEREYNRRMIQETEAKKKANTEGVGNPAANGSGLRAGESIRDMMNRKVNEGGGIDFKR